jgi:hypothetical protein
VSPVRYELGFYIPEDGMLRKIFLRNLRRLLVAASVVPSSPILVTLMKEALGSSETSVLTRATRRNIPEDTILHSHRRENLKSYTCCCLFPSEIFLNLHADVHNLFPISPKLRRISDVQQDVRL